MTRDGLEELENPAKLLLEGRLPDSHGSAICMVRDGVRQFPVEMQALLSKTNFGTPRRTTHGMDMSRLHLLLAVIGKFTPLSCDQFDAYINTIGGLKVKDHGSDLAVIGAVLSSRLEMPIPEGVILMGEVGLSGEVRQVSSVSERVSEAARLGFTSAIIPKSSAKISVPKRFMVTEISRVQEILPQVFGQ